MLQELVTLKLYGITSRELFDMIHSLKETKVTGVDIVELNPYHDNGATASLAAKIISTMIAMNLVEDLEKQ